MGLSPDSIEVVRVRVERPLLPESFHGFKIALMADLHYGSSGVSAELMEKAFELAMAEQPDVICFAGDMVTEWSRSTSLEYVLSIARVLRAPQGVYGVMGNHEFNWGEKESMRAFKRSNIHLLRNESVFLSRGKIRVPLIGLDNMFNQPLRDVRRQMAEIESHPGAIVVEHTPDFAPMIESFFRGLLLCGHTHGGQILLPLIGQAATASRFGLKYSSGLYPVGRGAMYITRGIGAVGIPCRIGCPPEVTILEISGATQVET